MIELLLIASVLLGCNLALSLLAMLRQPAASDRMLSAQLLGTNGVGLMLLLALSQEQAGLIDVALVLALLAAVVVIAFTRREQEPRHD
jgi:multicomponent Na+:H+ antiporter subunit F